MDCPTFRHMSKAALLQRNAFWFEAAGRDDDVGSKGSCVMPEVPGIERVPVHHRSLPLFPRGTYLPKGSFIVKISAPCLRLLRRLIKALPKARQRVRRSGNKIPVLAAEWLRLTPRSQSARGSSKGGLRASLANFSRQAVSAGGQACKSAQALYDLLAVAEWLSQPSQLNLQLQLLDAALNHTRPTVLR